MKKEKKQETFTDYIRRMVDELSDEILNEIYEISIRNASSDASSTSKFFGTSADHRYRQATICVYPRAAELYAAGKVDKLERILTHEMTHILTARLEWAAAQRFISQEELTDALEETVQSISMTICRLRDARG
jgi:hypothetical protein